MRLKSILLAGSIRRIVNNETARPDRAEIHSHAVSKADRTTCFPFCGEGDTVVANPEYEGRPADAGSELD